MTETTQTLRDDIAFMRALADEGVRPPLLAGPTMMLAGAVWGVSCFAAWVEMKFAHPSIWTQNAILIAPLVIFLGVLPFFRARNRRMPGYKSPANRAVGIAWAGAAWGIFALAACIIVSAWVTKNGALITMMPQIVIVLYGVAWTVSAAMTRDRFLWATAIASYISAIATSPFMNTPDGYLAFAIVLVLIAFIPGFVLWRREPKDIV